MCLQPKKRRDEWCQFYEIYNGRYLRYRSVLDPTRYIGFNRVGKPMTSPRGRQECYNFIKLNPFAGVELHNKIVSSNKGGLKSAAPAHQNLLLPPPTERTRKPPLHGKNTLVQSSSQETSSRQQHRHRHWKMMREEATRRRQLLHGRLLAAESKY